MLCATGSCARANKLVCVVQSRGWLWVSFFEEASCAHIRVALGSGLDVKPHHLLSTFVEKMVKQKLSANRPEFLMGLLDSAAASSSLSLILIIAWMYKNIYLYLEVVVFSPSRGFNICSICIMIICWY